MPVPAPGTTIGPYRIEGVIGAGSMGDVYRGVDTGLNRRVAIKILSERHKDSSELRARFVREGRAVAAIQHPNVVQVFATGNYEQRPYIAMELLEGTDLSSVVETRGPMSSAEAAQAILDGARGLYAACRAGLIHRDVKPSNLVRLTGGQVKVTDFGLAKPVDPGSEPALTALGVVVGTPDYIAPEQARGEAIDERVDIYALGGSLYYLLTGVPPFRTGVPAEDKYLKVVSRHLKNPPPDARERVPGVDPELAELARSLMAKKPADRPDYPTLIERLESIHTRLGREPRPPLPRDPTGTVAKLPFVDDDPLDGDDDHTGAGTTRAAISAIEPSGLPRWLWVLTALAVVTFVIGIVTYLSRRDPSRGEPPAPRGAARDAGSAPLDAQAASREPSPPDGMVLVRKADGSPWLFVDARPVTAAGYAAGTKTKLASGESGDAPVVGVSYAAAQAFATAAHKRLLASDEWDAAIRTSGVIALITRYEWVAPARGNDAVVRGPGKTATRATKGHKDVTFRLGQDLPK